MSADSSAFGRFSSLVRAYENRFVSPASYNDISFIRIVVCAIMVCYAVRSGALDIVQLPPSRRISMGIMDLLYPYGGLDWVVRHTWALVGLTTATVGVLLCGMVGLWTRPALILSALLYLPLVGIEHSYTKFDHAGLVPWYCLVVLCFSPCGQALSLDRLRQAAPVPANEANLVCGWSRYLVWFVIAVTYVMAGFSKIRNGGLFWWDEVNMQYMLYGKAFTPDSADRTFALKHFAEVPTVAFAVMGIGTLIAEIGMGLVLFSRRARIVFPLLCAGMHLGIILTMQIPFWDMIVLQILVAFDWRYAHSVWTRRSLSLAAAPTYVARPRSLLPFSALAGLVALFGGAWLLRAEVYPLTSMQMFSHRDRSGKITYFQIYGGSQQSELRRVYSDQLALDNNLAVAVLRKAFIDQKGREDCEALLRYASMRWNANRSEATRITRLQIRKLEWSFVRERLDPNYGSVVASIDIPVEASSP